MKKIHKNKTKDQHKSYKFLHWVLLIAFLSAALFMVQKNATDFQATVIPTKNASPYDGTTLPVLKVPQWTALSTDQWKLSYEQLPPDKLIPLPVYDPAILKTPTEQLGWKTESDLNIRNAKITFSTPYMGNYKLDGVEYGGSHLAVDIKVPNNTPVLAIGNGVASKVSEQSSGFGKHIVIKHNDFPSLNDPNAKTTIYSSYSHLGEVLIAEGDVVTKGQQIAKSGHTGTATTPHVHFQIDNDSAPWHPYWPFTYQEASAAGLDFTGAINAALGKDKALQTTINPVLYVQKYSHGTAASSTVPAPLPAPDSPSPTAPVDELPPTTSLSPSTQESTTPVTPPTSNPATSFKITHDGSFVPGVAETFELEALDVSGKTATGYKPHNGIYFQVLNGGADVPASLNAADFIDGKATFSVTPQGEIALKIRVTDNTISGESELMQSTVFSDISTDAVSYKAINFLKEYNVIGGYPNGSFQPEAVVSRVESLKFILKGVNSDLMAGARLPFKDTSAQEWYADYVATAYNKSIVGGYPDFTFKPANTVNRAEFFKMLLLAMDVKVNPYVTRDVYADVPMDAWYAPYVKYAKDKNLVEIIGKNFRPEEGMTRAEVAEAMYRIIMLKISEAKEYSSGMNVSAGKVREYFS